ncbi:MAG: hypothetical protein KDK08_05595 [Rhizobiaceae bacterium]|mgnify:CR=1 FL=1|nr:hypothetical protein [Rhizobiaceae bacterium]MCC0000942.1 hypothetical protein [Methylobacteriaceae bacterium]
MPVLTDPIYLRPTPAACAASLRKVADGADRKMREIEARCGSVEGIDHLDRSYWHFLLPFVAELRERADTIEEEARNSQD